MSNLIIDQVAQMA